jgi:oligopeptide/dipeptide ABC transporter ATP-binding protein
MMATYALPDSGTVPAPDAPLLDVRDLRTWFKTPRGWLHAVDGVSFQLQRGEALGVVGESGSGKSVTALTLLRLFGPLTHRRVSGQAFFAGQDLLQLSNRALRAVRGGQIGVVFQDPLTSLNPVLPVGEQIAESLRLHRGLSRAAAQARAIELLDLVGIPDPHRRIHDLPGRFSGGMRQRILIAIAIACEPKLLIADEPTTALDVTVQAQVLLLLDKLRRELGMALLLITHDFGVVAAICDRVQVMYAGRIVEHGPVTTILEHPNHPYTAGLIRLVPRFEHVRHHRLLPIPGQPLTVIGPFRGCRFAPRCELATDTCRSHEPPLVALGPDRASACWFAEDREQASRKAAVGSSVNG